jgi:hypothetical protein
LSTSLQTLHYPTLPYTNKKINIKITDRKEEPLSLKKFS